MFKKLKLSVSLVLVIIWFSLRFAVQFTSPVWYSQFEGIEFINIHSIVNLGSDLATSSDSCTASKQSCVINSEMTGLSDGQKLVLSKLYKTGRKIVQNI